MKNIREKTFHLLLLVQNTNSNGDYMNCYVCGKENLSKDELGITKKLIGLKTKKYYCIDCLANYLEVTTEELLDKIEEFKDEGCTLFS